jgi:hypothetical protein
VFQYGDRAAAHTHIRAAQDRLAPGGLFCLQVNAAATDVWPRHEVTEVHPDGGFTEAAGQVAGGSVMAVLRLCRPAVPGQST